jgi:hypothetical protein
MMKIMESEHFIHESRRSRMFGLQSRRNLSRRGPLQSRRILLPVRGLATLYELVI